MTVNLSPWILQDAPTELKTTCAHRQICYRFPRVTEVNPTECYDFIFANLEPTQA